MGSLTKEKTMKKVLLVVVGVVVMLAACSTSSVQEVKQEESNALEKSLEGIEKAPDKADY
jgi:uncharacterized lipoprotein